MRIKVCVTKEEYERFVQGEEVETLQIHDETVSKIEIWITEEELLKIEKVENIAPRPYRYTIKKNV